ncbi:1-acyl-sn-glycerol-3-phosphate acyltransferase [Candidatus Izemoplasma sp. B36]|uniref:1-acyl-sn-glycerol-3-phosphate acyltransferase n=1 Tax=Candidatus Izemoplasma sp. B36 TaxID=3242468 RepID=UPI0035577BE5
MKISDIVYEHIDKVRVMERFDMVSMPKKATWYLQLLAWILALPETYMVKAKIIKKNVKGLKGPYILLCNHNSFLDFKVATRAVFPRKSTYIVAVDGFINREGLMRNVGCFMKRKFVSDIKLVKQIKHSLEINQTVCQIYPEARYSLVGTQSMLPSSLGKLIKLMKYPVVTLIGNGHHLRQPFWNLKKRKVKTKAYMTQIITQDEINTISIDEINQRINEAFVYDDYKYQLDNNIKIKEKFRAEGLEKPLYMCPHCLAEFKMKTKDNRIWCENCNETYEMDELGRLSNINGETKFSHIPDWFEWERLQVRKEIIDSKYHVELDVDIDMLPNSTGYYRIGSGKLIHNKDGYHLIGENLDIKKPVIANFGVHIEYDYFGKGDCISFSTNEDTYYIYPHNQEYSVTKFHFATEELYKLSEKK